MKSVNPYVAGKPLRNTRTFFGRQNTLNWLHNELKNPGTNALVVFGQRRIGKTSLLLQTQLRLPVEDFLAVYFDLLDTSKLSLNDLLANLADTAAESAGLELPTKFNFNQDGTRVFKKKFLPWLLRS